ncbi:MAG: hypothetical protein ACI4HI_03055 [Lachnospiraceae bacterium]
MLMKKQILCKRWLTVLICLFFTISGISTLDGKNDSFFADTQKNLSQSIQWTQQHWTENPQDACTGEQIGMYDVGTILNIGFHVHRQVRVSPIVLFYVCAAVWLVKCGIGWRWKNTVCVPLHQSLERTIRYIHKKDGEKGNLS